MAKKKMSIREQRDLEKQRKIEEKAQRDAERARKEEERQKEKDRKNSLGYKVGKEASRAAKTELRSMGRKIVREAFKNIFKK